MISNHHHLLLALPGRGAERTAGDGGGALARHIHTRSKRTAMSTTDTAARPELTAEQLELQGEHGNSSRAC